MESRIDLQGLTERARALARNGRTIIAIAGPPGSGKSTLADKLVTAVNQDSPGNAALLAMDGFHFDDMVLGPMGKQAQKGAPDTFDVDGLRHMLDRLRRNRDAFVAVPVFDRDIEIARAGARLIPKSCALVVVEGNYLLLKTAPWCELAPYFDATVRIETNNRVLRDRLIRRWQEQGLAPDDIRRKVDGNDLPNGVRVQRDSAPADFVVVT